jgi:hypothetical protein
VAKKTAEYVPLWAPGLHVVAFGDLKSMCVDAFVESTSRATIFDGLSVLLSELASHGAKGEIWVDGSFVTKKTNPKDCDLVFAADGIQLSDASNTVLREYVKKRFDSGRDEVKAKLLCHPFFFPVFPVMHVHHSVTHSERAYWEKQFGFDRNKYPKGIAVLKLPVSP